MSDVSTSTFLDHKQVLAITSGLLFNRIKVLCICNHVVRIVSMYYRIQLTQKAPLVAYVHNVRNDIIQNMMI